MVVQTPVKLDDYAAFKADLVSWLNDHKDIMFNAPLSPASDPYEVYTKKMQNKEAFDYIFQNALAVLFKKSFKSCSDCRSYCPSVVARVVEEFGPLLSQVGLSCPNDTTGILALCMEKLCPAAFSAATCGVWRLQDGERQSALYAALGTCLLMACLFVLVAPSFVR
jgi:hypothetical protein